MTRTVQRRKPTYKVQPEKAGLGYVGLCGWCLGPPGSKIMHEKCAGMTNVNFTCTCRTCYGPDQVLPTPKKRKI
jgi:hypothetical protein